MGGSASAEDFLHTPLTPQTDFPFTTNKRFSQPRTTTLTLTDNFWGKAGLEGYAIKDAYSGKVVFRVETTVNGVAPREKTKWLVDAADSAPIAHLNQVSTSTTAYDLYAGGCDDNRLTQIEVAFRPFCDGPCKAVVEDPDTGEKCSVDMYGLWGERLVYIYLDRGMKEWGDRQAIAKVFRPDSDEVAFGSAEYHVEIASGVANAFVVLVCAALDDALQQKAAESNE